MRSQSLNHVYSILHLISLIFIWLVVSTPLKNICQLGVWFPIYGQIKFMFQTTNQKSENSNFPPISASFAIKPHGSSLFPIRSAVLPPWFSPWQSEVPRAQRCALRRPSGRRSRRRCRRRCPAASAPARWGDAATRRPRRGEGGMGWGGKDGDAMYPAW